MWKFFGAVMANLVTLGWFLNFFRLITVSNDGERLEIVVRYMEIANPLYLAVLLLFMSMATAVGLVIPRTILFLCNITLIAMSASAKHWKKVTGVLSVLCFIAGGWYATTIIEFNNITLTSATTTEASASMMDTAYDPLIPNLIVVYGLIAVMLLIIPVRIFVQRIIDEKIAAEFSREVDDYLAPSKEKQQRQKDYQGRHRRQ